MRQSQTLPFPHENRQNKRIPRYSIRLVRDAELDYNDERINSAAKVVDLLMAIGHHERASEEFHILYLDTKNHAVGMEMVSRGTLNASLVHPREVFKGAILANAKSVIIAHNHPSGSTEPSSADKEVTERLIRAGKILDIPVLDHVIIGSSGGYFSFNENSLICDSQSRPG